MLYIYLYYGIHFDLLYKWRRVNIDGGAFIPPFVYDLFGGLNTNMAEVSQILGLGSKFTNKPLLLNHKSKL